MIFQSSSGEVLQNNILLGWLLGQVASEQSIAAPRVPRFELELRTCFSGSNLGTRSMAHSGTQFLLHGGIIGSGNPVYAFVANCTLERWKLMRY